MSGADWSVGDLALCVDTQRPSSDKRPFSVKKGHVYTVLRTVFHNQSLVLHEFPDDWMGYWAHRFIKITPGSEITGKEAEKRIPIPHLFPETV